MSCSVTLEANFSDKLRYRLHEQMYRSEMLYRRFASPREKSHVTTRRPLKLVPVQRRCLWMKGDPTGLPQRVVNSVLPELKQVFKHLATRALTFCLTAAACTKCYAFFTSENASWTYVHFLIYPNHKISMTIISVKSSLPIIYMMWSLFLSDFVLHKYKYTQNSLVNRWVVL